MKLLKVMFWGQNRWRLSAVALLAILLIVASGALSETTALILLVGIGVPISSALLVHKRQQERRNRFYR